MATAKQEYAAALRDIAARFGNLEADTIRRSVALLAAMRDRLQLQLTSAEGFEAFRLQELSANVDAMIAQYEAQMIALSRQTLVTSSRLGALSVVEPLQAAGVAAGFFQPTPAQINVLLDFSADLIRGIGQQARQAINTEIRLAALGERSTTSAMQAINRRLGVADGKGIAYQGERILRTEMGRVYNVANQSQQQVTAQTVEGLQKMWVATGDGRTRLSHLLAHGQLRPIGQPFLVGGASLMHPLDPAAPARETVNCRCRTVTIHPEIGPIGGPLDATVTRERGRRGVMVSAPKVQQPKAVTEQDMFSLIEKKTGIKPNVTSYRVLSNEDFDAFARQYDTVGVENIAAYNQDGRITIRAGYEDSALHEFIHSAGFMPDNIHVMVNEGMTQSFTKDLAAELGIVPRSGYTDEVDYVDTYIIPLTGKPRADVFRGYAAAADKQKYLAELIWEQHGHRFDDPDDWGANVRDRFMQQAANSIRGDVYLRFLVDEARVLEARAVPGIRKLQIITRGGQQIRVLHITDKQPKYPAGNDARSTKKVNRRNS